MKTAKDKLNEKAMALGQKVYEEAAKNNQNQETTTEENNTDNNNDENVKDATYEEK